jgi:cytidine deaminase
MTASFQRQRMTMQREFNSLIDFATEPRLHKNSYTPHSSNQEDLSNIANIFYDQKMQKKTNEKILSTELKKLLKAAEQVRPNAYSPYSKVTVGAALLLSNGKIVVGANVENSSFGMTICAERAAVVSAISRFGPKIKIKAVAITAKKKSTAIKAAPCGACRQVLAEFAEQDCVVMYVDGQNIKITNIAELLPDAFELTS